MLGGKTAAPSSDCFLNVDSHVLFIKIIFLKETQTLILGYIFDNVMLKMCQKKLYKQGFDILKDFVSKIVLGNCKRSGQKLGHFSLMKHFGFML